MLKTVLVVDDDQEALLTLKERLAGLLGTFAISIAGDGLVAVKKLRKESISLVVADLHMPRMDGFELISHTAQNYPDLPVIAVTDHDSPTARQRAVRAGAVACLVKPFRIDQLVRLINEALKNESDGGILHAVSSGMFLQLVEMEQKTCTIRIFDQTSGNAGVLFFREGQLLDARCVGARGIGAAYRIFSWDEVDVSIQNACCQVQNVINSELQPIMLEAMRRKDEGEESATSLDGAVMLEEIEMIEVAQDMRPSQEDRWRGVGRELAAELGRDVGVNRIKGDLSWNPIVKKVENLGAFLDFGPFKAGYLVREEGTDIVLLPGGDEAMIMEASAGCPRDRLMRVLSRINM